MKQNPQHKMVSPELAKRKEKGPLNSHQGGGLGFWVWGT